MKSQRSTATVGSSLSLLSVYLVLMMLSSGALTQSCSNYGLSFNGNNGFQSDSSTPRWYALQEFTLEFWIMIDDAASEPQGVIQAFVVTGVTSCDIDGYGFYRYNKTLYFIMGGTDICDDNALAVTVDVDVWVHVAVTVSASKVDLYVDGELFESQTKTDPIVYDDAAFKVGLGPDPDSGFMVGELDEIRFWNTARSANQIKNNYKISLKNIDATLLAYWRFEEGSDNQVVDSSTYERQVIVSDTLDYTPNCEVASCLCNVEEYCVPTNDRTNEAIECPATGTSSSTKTSSSTSSSTSSTTRSTSTRTSSSTSKPVSTEDTDSDSSSETVTVENSAVSTLISIILLGFYLM